MQTYGYSSVDEPDERSSHSEHSVKTEEVQGAVNPATPSYTFRATHYGTSFNGSSLGCTGMGRYSSNDPTIVAVGYPFSVAFPCGARLQLSGPAGTIIAIRKDTCPGCGSNLIDLSESGITQVCGGLGSCQIRVTKLD